MMIIELEEPFKSRWNKGYLVNDNEGRKRIVLYNNPQDISGVTYARYLMCVKLGYILPTELEVDHIDDDKSNDDINNLQVLTKQQNLFKQYYNYVMNHQVFRGYHCAYCQKSFILTDRLAKMRIAQGVEMAFCGRSCAAFFHHHK